MAVKVNALKAGDPDRQAFVTHYKVLEAVIEELEKLKPAQILVGDSVGTESYGNTDHVFEVTRLKEVAGAYYRNFSKHLRLVELEKPFKRIVAVLNDVLESDVYISVPKMKTHKLTMLTIKGRKTRLKTRKKRIRWNRSPSPCVVGYRL